MRKLFLMIVALATISFVACEKHGDENDNNKPTEQPTPPEEGENEENEEEKDYIVLTRQAYNNTYRQGYEGLGVDRYYVGLCDTFLDMVEGTYLPDSNTGSLFWFALYGAPAADPENPTLPIGTYTLNGEEKVEGNLDPYYTYIVRRNDDGTPAQLTPTAATITIEAAGEEYIINLEYTLESGDVVKARYEGYVDLNVSSPLTAPTPMITEDYNTEFVGIHANIMESAVIAEGADCIGVQLFDAPLTEDSKQSGGILIKLELMAPALEGPSPMIPDGTYAVSLSTELYTTPVGDVINLGSTMGYTMIGTTARLMDSEGNYLYGAILSGEVVVTTTDLEQTIAVNLTTSEGAVISGEYTGAVTINGYNYTPPTSEDPFSTLTEDMELVANDEWLFTADYYTTFYEGRSDLSFIRLRGYSFNEPDNIFLIPMEGFEGFRFDLTINNDGSNTIPSGTYRAAVDGELKHKTFEVAYREKADGGTYYYGSYGWMGYDFCGYIDHKRLAPLVDGVLVIVDYGDGTYGIQYEVIDDAGNTITFNHRAPIEIEMQ